MERRAEPAVDPDGVDAVAVLRAVHVVLPVAVASAHDVALLLLHGAVVGGLGEAEVVVGHAAGRVGRGVELPARALRAVQVREHVHIRSQTLLE